MRLEQRRILIPNPHYQAPIEKEYYKLEVLQYPDLSQQANRDFNIQIIELEKELESLKFD